MPLINTLRKNPAETSNSHVLILTDMYQIRILLRLQATKKKLTERSDKQSNLPIRFLLSVPRNTPGFKFSLDLNVFASHVFALTAN